MCDLSPTEDCYCQNFMPNVKHCPPTICHHESAYKITLMLSERLTKKAYNVHKFYLKDFIKDCPYGFYVRDLGNLTKIFEQLAERLEKAPLYKPYLKKLLEMSATPPLFHDNNDKLTGGPLFSDFLTVLGLTAIWVQDFHLRALVYKALIELLTNKTQLYISSANFEFRINAVELSNLPEVITQLIEIVPKKGKEYIQVLSIAEVLTKISSKICRKMLVVNALDYLLLRLLPENVDIGSTLFSNLNKCKDYTEMSEITCHILLNLVRSLRHEKNDFFLDSIAPSENSLWAIRYIFRIYIQDDQSKFARNMIMEIILVCLEVFPYLKIVECNLAHDLVKLSMTTLIKQTDKRKKAAKFIHNDYDITFHKMILICLCYLEKYTSFKQILETKYVIDGLLVLCFDKCVPYLHPDQHFVLKQYSLSLLYYAAPTCYEKFLHHDGPARLLKIMEGLVNSHYCREVSMHQILKVFDSLMGEKQFVDYLKEHQAFHTFQLTLREFIGRTSISYNHRVMIGYSFHICATLYDENIPDDDSCIELIILYFRRILNPIDRDACMNLLTIIASMDYLWTIIKTSRPQLKQFIKMEGVYLLLDMIDTFTIAVQVIGLGVLVDICEEKLCLPFLLTWRGGPDKKCIFFSLLARIFRAECRKIGTWLNANDIIQGLTYPLMGKIQRDELLTGEKNANISSSIADMLGSVRPKIYAVLQLLSTRYGTEVDVINNHYKIANIKIPRNDIIILHLAKNFFALKLSESWYELTQDLANSGVEPVAIDTELLYLLIERMSKWNSSVKEEQEALLKVQFNEEIALEKSVYEILNKCKLQESIEALKELAYFARTTDKMFRIAYKKKQNKEIKKTSQMPMYKFMKDTNVTAFYNMHMELGIQLKED